MTAAVLTITSCSKDESTEVNNGQAIDFRVAMETRATETTTANITNFLVTAINPATPISSPIRRSRKRALTSPPTLPTIGPTTAAISPSSPIRLQPRIWALPSRLPLRAKR